MMLQLLKSGPFFFICVLSSMKGSQVAADCANITNLTRISATSVVVEWEYSLPLMIGQEFEIKISELKNASAVQQFPIMPANNISNDRYAHLLDNSTATLIADTQILCFVISVVTDMFGSQMIPQSSGEMTASEDTCPKKCLPSMSQVPAAPEGFTAIYTTTTFSEVEFSWNATESSVILACNASGMVVPTIIKQFCGSCSPVSVGGFRMPSTQYTCSLSEMNGFTVGYSSVINFFTDVQRLSPVSFSITANGTTSITIQFALSFSFNAEYQITTKLLSNGQRVGDPLTNLTRGRTNIEAIIGSLYPFTTYKIELQIRNTSTMHLSYPFSRKVKTLEEAPGKISHNSLSVHTLSNTSSMILVAWEPPAITNGSITSYKYCWSRSNETSVCAMTTSNSTIINLNIPAHVYTVKVAANTGGGRGPFSDNVYVYVPGAAAPNTGYGVILNNRTSSIQLKFRGLNNCSLWMDSGQVLQDDITFDLLTQLSNLCNCDLSQSITNVLIQCNDAINGDTDEIVFQAIINSRSCPTINNCEVQDIAEQWIRGPSPYVRVGSLGHSIFLDRSCPLYTTSLISSECLDTTPVTTTETMMRSSSGNGGAVAGGLIGGILFGVILTVGVGLGIFLLLWQRQRRGKKVPMMKKLDPNTDTMLSKRYIPSIQDLNQSNDDYEPISAYVQDGSKDRGVGNTYESQTDNQGPAKGKKQKKNSNKDSGKQHVIEDESGYVVPDTLWEGKQRPVAPGSAKSAKTPSKTSEYATIAPETTTKVEYDVPIEKTKKTDYDVPEGVEPQNTSRVKGQREPQSQQKPTGTLGQKERVQQTPTGKDHQKQSLQVKQPSKITGRPEQSQNNELNKPAAQGGKPTKKNKPKLYQKKANSSELALQYQSDTSTTSAAAAAAAAASTAPHAHDAVKSKLQNLFSPIPSSQPATKATHAKLSKQPSSSAAENIKVQQQEPQVSKVMAMAQKLQGAGQASAAAGGSETSDSKTVGTKKKPLLPKPGGSSIAIPAQQQQQQPSKDTTSHLLPTKKPKPAGKGTANISMKSNKAYDNWSREEDGVVPTQKPSAHGGGRGNQNLYRF